MRNILCEILRKLDPEANAKIDYNKDPRSKEELCEKMKHNLVRADYLYPSPLRYFASKEFANFQQKSARSSRLSVSFPFSAKTG